MKNIKISVFKSLFKSTDVPFDLTLEQIVTRIRTGSSKNKIDLIRNGNKEIKKKLPSIIFAGEFSERNRKGLKKQRIKNETKNYGYQVFEPTTNKIDLNWP